MSDIGTPPELAWLPVDKLDVDERYQRSLETKASQRLIDKIAAQFNGMKFQALSCARRADDPERYLVIDGQHRNAGAKKRGDIPDVPALVYASASLAEQATAFVAANKDRVSVSAQAMFYAQLVADDPEALAIAAVCDREQIRVSRHNKAAATFGARETAAVPMLRRILRRHGAEQLMRTVNIVVEAWGDQPGALQSGIFMAVSMYLDEKGDEKALRRTLAGRDWRQLLQSAINAGGAEHGRGRLLCDTLKEWVALQSRANAGDSAAAATQAAAGTDPASRLAGGRTPALQAAARTSASEGEAQTSASGVTGGESAATCSGSRDPIEAALATIRSAGREVEAETSRIGQRWRLDGRQTATRDELIDIANRIRRRAGQPLLDSAA